MDQFGEATLLIFFRFIKDGYFSSAFPNVFFFLYIFLFLFFHEWTLEQVKKIKTCCCRSLKAFTWILFVICSCWRTALWKAAIRKKAQNVSPSKCLLCLSFLPNLLFPAIFCLNCVYRKSCGILFALNPVWIPLTGVMKTGPLLLPRCPATNGPRFAVSAPFYPTRQRQQQEQCFRLHPACQMCEGCVQTHRNTHSGDDETGNIDVLTAAVGGNKKALLKLNVYLLKHLKSWWLHAGYRKTRLAISIFSNFPD